eukprot:2897004-Amphidinium_carterae.1
MRRRAMPRNMELRVGIGSHMTSRNAYQDSQSMLNKSRVWGPSKGALWLAGGARPATNCLVVAPLLRKSSAMRPTH